MNDEETSDEDLSDFIEDLKKAGLKITHKRKCIKMGNAKKQKTKFDAVGHVKSEISVPFVSASRPADSHTMPHPNPITKIKQWLPGSVSCKSSEYTCINLEKLPILEKYGEQYIVLNSGISLQSVSKTSQDFNSQFNISPSKQYKDTTPMLCVPVAPIPANVQSNQITSESLDVPAYPPAPLNQVTEGSVVPTDIKPTSSLNDLPETLTPLVCTPIAPPAFRDVFEDDWLSLSRDNLPKATVPLGCLPLLSPSLIEAPAGDQTQLSDLSEAPVSLMCSPPLSPSIIEAPTKDQQNRSLAFQGNIQTSLHAPLLPYSTNPSSNNRVLILSDVPYYGDITQSKKRNSKATKDPKIWQRNLAKDKREKGECYLGYRRDTSNAGSAKFKVKHDVLKPARSLNPPCTSAFCFRSKLRACDIITPESRQELFTTFWKKMSWEQRRAYICSHVIKTEKKITKNPDSNRGESRAYYITIEHARHQVCKKMFLATLGIKEWFVRYWLEKTDCAMPPDTQTSQNGRKGPEKTNAKEYLIQFLTKLPKMPSHYCRQSTSKLYLEPVFDSMVELYKVYKNECETDSQQFLGRKVFISIFDKLNFALYQPKKDQCDVCCSYKIGNLNEEEYNLHIAKKTRARAEKATDKLFGQNGTCHVFTQDVESVKMVPFLQASAIYYKTKLCVHNFTLYNLATHEVMCYWFDESNSSLEASVFASCVVEHISSTLNKKRLPVILYSDGCCAQNRNAILSNALLRLAIEKNVVITQKYLEKGHIQMECDSVHSAIECKVKGKEIYLPDQYVDISKKSRTHPMPYEGKLLDYNFFTDFSKHLIYKSIRPGKKAGDPVVTDIRLLEYSPEGIIRYKTSFDEELKPLPLRPTPIHRIKLISELPKLYKDRLPIANRKYQDLQDLKSVIPEKCHLFYDQLPHI